jgi:hypothetical protein
VTKEAAVAQGIFVFSSKSAKQMQEFFIILKKKNFDGLILSWISLTHFFSLL